MRLSLPLTFLLLSACTMSPELVSPAIDTPTSFAEEKASEGSWKVAEKNAKLDTKSWWNNFNEETLNSLITEATEHNPSLEAATARMQQAYALAGVTDASLFPSISINGGSTRQQNSRNGQIPGFPPYTKPYTIHRAQGVFDYGLDIFGRARAASHAAWFNAEAAEASHRAAILLLQTDVAENYFRLRALNRERALIAKQLKLLEESQTLTKRRFDMGETNELDYTSAQTELANARAESLNVEQQFAQTNHALAILLGKAPANFSAENASLEKSPPFIPAGLPSALLERRPDITAAQKTMAAANENIGVARAAFFPSISLTGAGSLESRSLSDLFTWSSKSWLISPLVSLPIFEGGKNVSNLALSKASYREASATYREKVLNAFREVEDALSQIRYLNEQAETVTTALTAARRAHEIAQSRYNNGYISYLEFIDVQRTLLATERREVQILGARYQATIQLIRVLGGGWGEVEKEQKKEQ